MTIFSKTIKLAILSLCLILLLAVFARSVRLFYHKSLTRASFARRVTVTFDYDFGRTPLCSSGRTQNCVQQFNVYDFSVEGRKTLFAIPVPAGAKGVVRGITATSPSSSLVAGEHRIAVTAQSTDGAESAALACETVIEVKSE